MAQVRNIYFSEETWKMLEEYADNHGLSISAAVRELVLTYTEKTQARIGLIDHRDALARRLVTMKQNARCSCGSTAISFD